MAEAGRKAPGGDDTKGLRGRGVQRHVSGYAEMTGLITGAAVVQRQLSQVLNGQGRKGA